MLGARHGEVKLFLERKASSLSSGQSEYFCKKHTGNSRLGKPEDCRYFEYTILEHKIISRDKRQPQDIFWRACPALTG